MIVPNTDSSRFLLAQIYLGFLEDKTTPKEIRIALKDFEKQQLVTGEDQKLQVLSHAYDQTMKRINGQKRGLQELSMKVLSWITYAKRPLKTLELQHALAIQDGDVELDEENLPDIEQMVSVCAGLVTVDQESNIIRLVHYTTQEYFERTHASWFPHAHTNIGKACVTYLSFNSFETGYCQTTKEFRERLDSNVLYEYATQYWGHHVCGNSIERDQLILNFLKCEPKVIASNQVVRVFDIFTDRYASYSQKAPRRIGGMLLAAYFGLMNTMQALVDDGLNPGCADDLGQTTLMLAAREGYIAMVELLLKHGVDVNVKNEDGRTALMLAAIKGQTAAVELLVANDRVDVNAKDEEGRTALILAAIRGHTAAVELLVANDGVDVNAKDKYGWTALMSAASLGHTAVVEPLLKHGVDVNAKREHGWTALMSAASLGYTAVVEPLLKHGVDVNAKEEDGWTALMLASGNAHTAVMEQLLKHGVDVNAKRKDGWTALMLAANYGNTTVVEPLLKHGVDVNDKDIYGQTALTLAASHGHTAVVELLGMKTLTSTQPTAS